MNKKTWLALACALTCPLAFGVQLVKDINAVPVASAAGGVNFEMGVQLANGTLFFLTDLDHGAEPWITDGTPAGTRLLLDIRPGPDSSEAYNVTLVNGVAYFYANDGANGIELWRSDGTTPGTRVVANIGAGAADGISGVIVNGATIPVINGVLYFTGNDGTSGSELWRSDGTANGTYRVADAIAGSGGISPEAFKVIGSRLFFNGTDSAGIELWTSDGTAAGTRRLTDFPNAGAAASVVTSTMVSVGNGIFFSANDGEHGSELWRMDANATSMRMVVDFNTFARGNGRTEGAGPYPVGVIGNTYLFTAGTTGNELIRNLYRITAGSDSITLVLDSLPLAPNVYGLIEFPNSLILSFASGINGGGSTPLFVTDGTAAGTRALNTDLVITGDAVRGNGEVFFFAQEFAPGNKTNLWRTDGTVAGTREYAHLDFTGGSTNLELVGGRLYFANLFAFDDPAHGRELWTSDGTVGGTYAVDFTPGPMDSGGGMQIAARGGKLFLGISDGESATEPWVSDGTLSGSQRLVDIEANFVTAGSQPGILGSLGPDTYFIANDGVHGNELWATDGTNAGTRMLRDRANGDGVTVFGGFLAMNGFALFCGVDGDGAELWRTDGTSAGTFRVADIKPGPGSGVPSLGGVTLNGVAYFSADDGVNGPRYWRSDGTAAGTRMLDLFPAGVDAAPLRAIVNGRFFFYVGGAIPSLWSSDGTAAGTALVSSTVVPADFFDEVVFQNRYCFKSYIAVAQLEIFCTNGTAGNMEQITNFAALGFSPTRLSTVGGKLVMIAYGPGLIGGGLYVSDGTMAGLSRISDLRLNGGALSLNGGAKLAFVELDGANTDIIETDGTAAGTRSMLSGLTIPRSNYLGYVAVNDSIVLSVNDPVKGPVVWKTDGTAAGTRFLFDLNPYEWTLDGYPGDFLVNGNRIFFTASRPDVGRELWQLSTTHPNTTDESAGTPRNTAVDISVLANDSDFDSDLGAANLDIVAPPAFGTASVNSSTGTITYVPNNGYSGADSFVYRVADAQGNFSNNAKVSITVATSTTVPDPGTPPVVNPPPPPPPQSGGGGGGGALGLELLPLALLLFARRRRQLH